MTCYKTPYDSEADAKRVLGRLKDRRRHGDRRRHEQAAYLCRHCGKWHLTSKTDFRFYQG